VGADWLRAGQERWASGAVGVDDAERLGYEAKSGAERCVRNTRVRQECCRDPVPDLLQRLGRGRLHCKQLQTLKQPFASSCKPSSNMSAVCMPGSAEPEGRWHCCKHS
jgi:hypothetical protein